MKVFRVENRLGEGPYTFDAKTPGQEVIKSGLLNDHNSSPGHPAWSSDYQEPWANKALVSGFDSIEDLHQWFGRWLPRLEFIGFSVAVYEVTHREPSYSGRQIRFIKPKPPIMQMAMKEERVTFEKGDKRWHCSATTLAASSMRP